MGQQKATNVHATAEAVSQWVRDHDILVVPALPETEERVVHVGPQVMSLEEFCRTAANLGARALYQEVDVFDAEDFARLPAPSVLASPLAQGAELPDPEEALDATERKSLTALRAAASRRHGQATSIELCFIADSVAHFWCDTASWWDDLNEQWDTFTEQLAATRNEREEQAEAAEQVGTDATITEMADVLASLPAFRAATNATARRAVADEAFPDPDDGGYRPGFMLGRALTAATNIVQAGAMSAYRDVEARIDDIAKELVASDVLASATNQPTRRIKAADFLTTLTGGYPPSSRTVTLLLGHPIVSVPRSRTPRPAPDALPFA